MSELKESRTCTMEDRVSKGTYFKFMAPGGSPLIVFKHLSNEIKLYDIYELNNNWDHHELYALIDRPEADKEEQQWLIDTGFEIQ